jgi:Zn-dependent protease
MMLNTLVVAETFLAFVIAITLHGAAHAAMAAILGDGSAVAQQSVNPKRHMAVIGTIVAITLSFGIPFGFPIGSYPAGLGWGKPVEVDARRMRVSPDTGVFLVALAGPFFNFFIGVFFAILLHFMPGHQDLSLIAGRCGFTGGSLLLQCLSQAQPFWLLRIEQLLYILAATNILLAVVNFIPLHPLDGYDLLFALLPNRPAVRFRDFKPYMELILLLIFFVLPYLLSFFGLTQLNPGYWISALAQYLTGLIAGPAFPAFIYHL